MSSQFGTAEFIALVAVTAVLFHRLRYGRMVMQLIVEEQRTQIGQLQGQWIIIVIRDPTCGARDVAGYVGTIHAAGFIVEGSDEHLFVSWSMLSAIRSG